MKVIQKIILLFVTVLFTLPMMAQEVSYGFRTGWSSQNVYLTEGLDALPSDFRSIRSFTFGAVAEIPVAAQFSFQPELLYTTKGFAVREDFGINLFDISLPVGMKAESRFRYLEMPLLGKLTFGDGPAKAYAIAGPSVGYALNGLLQTKASILVDIKLLDTPINLNDINYERFELSGVVGGGFSYETSMGKFFVDARYQHGFTGLYDIPVVEEKIRNKGFGINAGIVLPLGGAPVRP